jgi:MFS transporter, OPA family, glycerol-3-phosphate transporter
MIIGGVEFCSGYLRNGILQWYTAFAKDVGAAQGFVALNWGLLTCVAGILGGMFAGVISDRLFQSRRGPVSAVLYGASLVAIAAMWLFLGSPLLGWAALLVYLCIIGVHGMLSGTASMDFGGRKNAGIAVGIIDGLVYFGTSLGGFLLGSVLPSGAGRKDPANWWIWPAVMVPAAACGLFLALQLWNARPKAHAAAPAK